MKGVIIIKVIALCGSLKYQYEMMKVAEILSLKGNCILTPIYPTNDTFKLSESEIRKLKVAHLKRIELSDAIYVVNKDKYIGNSTKKEIEYAKSLNKEIIYMK